MGKFIECKTFTTTVGTPLTLATVTANDLLDGVVTVVQGGVTPNFNAIGTYAVIYTATDAAGNSSTIIHTYQVNALPDITPSVSPTTMSFSGVTPDTKNTQYNDLSICLNDSIVGGGNISLNSSNGGVISNLNIDGEGRVIFDFLTPNINGTILTLTGLDSIGNRFNITLNLALPLRSNL